MTIPGVTEVYNAVQRPTFQSLGTDETGSELLDSRSLLLDGTDLEQPVFSKLQSREFPSELTGSDREKSSIRQMY